MKIPIGINKNAIKYPKCSFKVTNLFSFKKSKFLEIKFNEYSHAIEDKIAKIASTIRQKNTISEFNLNIVSRKNKIVKESTITTCT